MDAVSLQGRCQGFAVCIVVQLPERFLRLTQMLQRSPLPGQDLISEQTYEKFVRIIGFLVHQTQPMSLFCAHIAKFAALLQ